LLLYQSKHRSVDFKKNITPNSAAFINSFGSKEQKNLQRR